MPCAFGIAGADEHPEQHPRDVGVEDRRALAERETHDRAGGVGADALERQQRRLVRLAACRRTSQPPRGRSRAGAAAGRCSPAATTSRTTSARRRAASASRSGTCSATRDTSAARDRPASAGASLRRRGCDTGRGSRATAGAAVSPIPFEQAPPEPLPRGWRGQIGPLVRRRGRGRLRSCGHAVTGVGGTSVG